MYQSNTVDCENFQDLGNWCSPLLTEDLNLKDTAKVDMIEENTVTQLNTHSLHTWNSIDTTIRQEGDNYSFSPTDAFSPNSELNTPGVAELSVPFDSRPRISADAHLSVIDINQMKVVLEMPTDVCSPHFDTSNRTSPDAADDIEWMDVFDTIKTDTYISGNASETHAGSPRTHTGNAAIMANDVIEIIEDEEGITENMEMLSWGHAYPAHVSGDFVVGHECMLTNRTKQCNDMIVAEFILSENETMTEAILPATVQVERTPKLNLNVNLKPTATQRYTLDGFKFMDPIVTTPDVLRAVEELEADKKLPQFSVEKPTLNEAKYTNYAGDNDHEGSNQESHDDSIKQEVEEESSFVDSNVPSPDCNSPSMSHLRSHKGSDDDDSDESYAPPSEKKPVRKYRKRKITLPQQIPATPEKKARRGRPPKRRESVASTNTTDDNMSSMSIESSKYRELRDKNNEASRRSRMNRKSKELDMERLADILEEKNKTLKVRAEMLESVTKRLKDALMSAILNK